MTDTDLFTYNPPAPVAFDGVTYDWQQDHERLKSQLWRVFNLISDGKWRTLSEIAEDAGGSEASVSARLRDLKKEQYGAHTVEKEHVRKGLWRYRMVKP